MKPGASAARMPAKLFVKARASVTAGFANDVDAVNQYLKQDMSERDSLAGAVEKIQTLAPETA